MSLSARLAAIAACCLCAGAVQAACLQELRSLAAEYGDIHPSAAAQKRLWTEKKTALMLNDRGKPALCHDLIKDMQEQLAELQRLDKISPPGHFEQDARQPVTDVEHLFRADDIIGTPVINTSNERLGIIEALTFESMSGRIRYVVIDSGRLLDAESRPVAIPWNKLSWIEGEHVFVVDTDRASLQQAPAIGDYDWPDSVDSSWMRGADNPENLRRRPRE
jgi:sporulation protein YlmC with PRC-barrel domain